VSTLETVRLFLHVLAATVWVGGQLTLLGLLPVLREVGGEAPRQAARAFRRIAWPAFAVLLVTGAWNVAELSEEGDGGGVLVAKLVAVVLSGVASFLHERAPSKAMTAVWGAVGLLAALAALLLGVVLSGD
jgi:putative copper export protein